MVNNKQDFFDDKAFEYVVTSPDQKKFHDNFLFNNKVFSYITQTGMGYSRYIDEDDYMTYIVAGTRDEEQFEYSRTVYIRDNATGEFWSVGWAPVCKAYEHYECKVGMNYQAVTNTTNGVTCKWTVMVPQGDAPVELWKAEISAEEGRDLSVFFYTELSLDTTYQTYGHDLYCDCKHEDGAIKAVNNAMLLQDKMNAVTVSVSRSADSYTCGRGGFVGQYRTEANPIGVTDGVLPCTDAVKERMCAAFCFNVKGSETIYQSIVLHNKDDKPDVPECQFDALLADTKAGIIEKYNKTRITSADKTLDMMMNVWSKRQSEFGALHCRWGIKGYRDLVQHGMGCLYFDPSITKKILNKALAHQMSSGFAVRSFPAVHDDSGMHYSDSAAWLIYTITEYVKETGDAAYLSERVPFLDGGSSTVLERIDLIIDSLFSDRGEHGLVRIHSGDWNDSLTHVGVKGRGESVWFTMFLAKAMLIAAELKEFLSEPSETYITRYGQLKKAVNDTAWDGEWYIRAFNDDGGKVGSKDCAEGKIFLNAQSWAIISGIAEGERVQTLIASVEKHLQTDYGYILNHPHFTKPDPSIGRMTVIEPGTAENGSSYSHGNAFWALAMLEAGDAERAYKTLCMINPQTPALEGKPIVPYTYGNCYFGPAHATCPGKMEFSWVTGSVNWIAFAVIERMFGARRGYGGIVSEPNLPASLAGGEIFRSKL